MNADLILTPAILVSDRLLRGSFEGPGRNKHRFGGPLDVSLAKWPRKFLQPHRLLSLRLTDPALALDSDHYSSIPLIYGLQVSGCRMTYQVNGRSEIKLLSVEGERAKTWPYPDYPKMLPTMPLFFERAEKINWKKLENDEDWSGITQQDSRPKQDEILVIVPPNDAYGVSLWEASGDAENVQVIFRINMKSLLIEAWNECT